MAIVSGTFHWQSIVSRSDFKSEWSSDRWELFLLLICKRVSRFWIWCGQHQWRDMNSRVMCCFGLVEDQMYRCNLDHLHFIHVMLLFPLLWDWMIDLMSDSSWHLSSTASSLYYNSPVLTLVIVCNAICRQQVFVPHARSTCNHVHMKRIASDVFCTVNTNQQEC